MGYRYYCFEYVFDVIFGRCIVLPESDIIHRFIWIARGLSLSQRIRHLEERWAYYFAFGKQYIIWLLVLSNEFISV